MFKNLKTLPYALLNCPLKFNPFQYDPYIEWKKGRRRLYIADEVGLGKTIETGIIIKEELQNEPMQKFLLVAPKFLCEQWKEQLQTLFNIDCVILNKGLITNRHYPVQILPISQIKNFVKEFEFKTVIVDEAHYFRNEKNSVRYKDLKNIIVGIPQRIFLSATPINNYRGDLTNQIKLLTENEKDFFVIHNKKIEAFPFSKVRSIQTIYVDLDDNEKKFYSTTDQSSDSEFGKTIYKHVGASSLYALKKCYENNGLDELEKTCIEEEFDNEYTLKDNFDICLTNIDSKLEKVKEIIKESGDKKIIIFAHYIYTCEHLYKNLKEDKNAFLISGQMKLSEQQEIKNRFQERDGKAVLICSDVCKEGVNLQCASVLINYDLPFNPAIIEQRIGRIDRVGQENEISIYNLVVNNTYDTTVYYQHILGKLKIIKAYAKADLVNEMNITDNEFIIAIRKAVEQAEGNIKNLTEIWNYLYNVITQNNQLSSDDKVSNEQSKPPEKIEELKSDISDMAHEIWCNYLEENQTVNRQAYDKKVEEFNNSFKNFSTFLKGKREILLAPQKVKEFFINDPNNRKYLMPMIKNSKEICALLENEHTITESDRIEVKDKIEVSFEYLNPDINKGVVDKITPWTDYVENFIPYEIIEKVKQY